MPIVNHGVDNGIITDLKRKTDRKIAKICFLKIKSRRTAARELTENVKEVYYQLKFDIQNITFWHCDYI